MASLLSSRPTVKDSRMHIGRGPAHGIGRVAWCRTSGYCVEAFGGARSTSLLHCIEAQDVLAPSSPLRKSLSADLGSGNTSGGVCQQPHEGLQPTRANPNRAKQIPMCYNLPDIQVLNDDSDQLHRHLTCWPVVDPESHRIALVTLHQVVPRRLRDSIR